MQNGQKITHYSQTYICQKRKGREGVELHPDLHFFCYAALDVGWKGVPHNRPISLRHTTNRPAVVNYHIM